MTFREGVNERDPKNTTGSLVKKKQTRSLRKKCIT